MIRYLKSFWPLILILGGIYLVLFLFSFKGYGYAGYGGYNRGPSFFYWGGARYYPTYYGPQYSGGGTSGKSIRGGGSGSGRRTMGGGPRGGK